MGNICRSPAAHAVAEQRIADRNLDSVLRVDSSGTIAYHAGEPADSRMSAELAKHGIKNGHRSQQFRESDFDEFDLILAMDRRNLEDIKSMARDEADLRKLAMFRDFDPEGSGEVPDPYYGGREGFTRVYDMVDRTVDEILTRFEAGELTR
jgi:protein-tyrosine phosphatase